MFPAQIVEYLRNLQDDPYQHIKIEGYGSEVLQILDLQVDDLDVVILYDFRLGGGLKVAEEVDLVHLAELSGVVLHARGAADIPIHKHSNTLHINIIYYTLYVMALIRLINLNH